MLPLLGLICFYCYHCIFLAAATVCYRALQIASSLVLQYCCSHWQTLYHITGGLGPLDFFSSFEHIQYKRTIYELWRISSQWLVFPSNLHKNVFCGLCPTTTKVLYLDRKRMLDHIYTYQYVKMWASGVRLISTGLVQRLGRTLTRVLIGDV